MKSFTLTAIFFILMLINNIQAQSVSANGSAKALKATEKSSEQSIQWLSFQEAIEKNKKKPKKIFIDVYTDWCGWCKVMDKQTFTDPFIIEYMNANFYAVKLNAEKDEKIEFKGKEYSFVPQNGRGYHELAAELMSGRMSYPTVVFLDEKMDLLQPIPGFRKPSELDMFLKFYGGDHYKGISFDVFTGKYQSPYEGE